MTAIYLLCSLYQLRIRYSITTLWQELQFFPLQRKWLWTYFPHVSLSVAAQLTFSGIEKCFALPPTMHLKSTDEQVHSQY